MLNLCNSSILNLAVDRTKLLSEHLLSLVNESLEAVLDRGSPGLVATLGDNLGIVGGTTAVPGKELEG